MLGYSYINLLRKICKKNVVDKVICRNFLLHLKKCNIAYCKVLPLYIFLFTE